MASSDDEGEPVLHSVSDYNFVDDSDDPVSFSELPVQWSDGERTGSKQKQIFMHGSTDNGLQKIYKQVEAWKFELSNVKPEISVLLSKENIWMRLEKPRKSHEDIFRTILITLHSLHFLSRNPEASGRALCENLCKVFRFEPGPENDLADHAILISEAVKRDEVLAKAKILTTFLDKYPKKWNFFDKSQDAEASTTTKSAFIVDDIIDESEEAESDDEEQGDKVCAICDNGGDILCCEGKCLRSFHATEKAGSDSTCDSLGFTDEQVEAIQNFYCKNCLYKRHQCFACGKLGSSDDKSSDCEVFRCVSGECGRFYHPHCVSKLLYPARESEAKELEGKISSGASFTCPFHKCCVCKLTETEGDPDLRFAMCRRCPKSYHKKCLPREIVFDGSDDVDDDVLPRAWEKLMPKKRILIYCLEHEIDKELASPLRNHIKFPMKKRRYLKPTIGKENVSSAIGRDKVPSAIGRTCPVKSVASKTSSLPPLDAESERRILALMKDATSSITLSEINEKHKVPTTDHAFVRTITMEKVESSVEALREAVKKLEIGGNIEDARALCGPGLLNEMMKCKNKLRVYLAPFLLGERYTSFGRHFTKMDKLEKVVDKLHWYAEDGDMIVDFCCGANEFSCLMRKRLDEDGKKCYYKNYDVMQPKNDFNFEKRDWMTVDRNELPSGSQLIMGLSPPFGAKSANKFIDKALKFKPKLIALIVPPETERLDKKDPPYDLVFEDSVLLAGKSFYLPGHLDVSGKQMDQLYTKPRPLSFWSRMDWTAKHQEIAEIAKKNGDFYMRQEMLQRDELKKIGTGEISMKDIKRKGSNDISPDGKNKRREVNEVEVRHDRRVLHEISPDDKKRRGSYEMSPEARQNIIGSRELSPIEKQNSSFLHRQYQSAETTSLAGIQTEKYHHFDVRVPGPQHFGARYDGIREDAMAYRYETSYEDPYQSSLYENRISGIQTEKYQHFDVRVPGPQHFGARYDGIREDAMAYRYETSYEDPYQSSLYENRISEAQFQGYQRESIDHHGYMPYNRNSTTSTMQRYAPRLDELNQPRVNNLGPDPALPMGGVYDPRALPIFHL